MVRFGWFLYLVSIAITLVSWLDGGVAAQTMSFQVSVLLGFGAVLFAINGLAGKGRQADANENEQDSSGTRDFDSAPASEPHTARSTQQS